MTTFQRAPGMCLLVAAWACGRENLASAPIEPDSDDYSLSEGAYSQALDGRVEVHGARDDDGYVRAHVGDERGNLLLELKVGEPSGSKVQVSYTYYAAADGNPDYDELKGEQELSWRRGTEITPRTASELLTFLYGSISAEDACFTRHRCDFKSWFSFAKRKSEIHFRRLEPEAAQCQECTTLAWECIADGGEEKVCAQPMTTNEQLAGIGDQDGGASDEPQYGDDEIDWDESEDDTGSGEEF